MRWWRGGFASRALICSDRANRTSRALFIEQIDQVAVLGELIAEVGDRPIFLAGISFGGVIALRYAIDHGDTIAGLVPMSSFAEMPPQLFDLAQRCATGLDSRRYDLFQDLLFPMNFSSEWLEAKAHMIDFARYRGWLVNDVYALHNLMESFLDFEPLTPKLSAITMPTMILTGEYDFLTPRAGARLAARSYSESELVILQRAYHAFTLEKPELTAYLVARFAEDVMSGRWQGKKSIWLAPEEIGGEFIPFPAGYDHLRAVPVRLPQGAEAQPELTHSVATQRDVIEEEAVQSEVTSP